MKFNKLLPVLMTTLHMSTAYSAEESAVVSTLEGAHPITFAHRSLTMAGNIYLPDGFEASKKYPAVICVHPGGGVKEQTAGLYAQQLAKQGFVTLAFDASYQGESSGEPRFLDKPMNRVEDVFSAVGYMATRPDVNAEQIGVLGICAGGGFAVKAASLDHRIKVVGTVSAVDVGDATREGWAGKGPDIDLLATVDAARKQRAAEEDAEAAPVHVPYVPELGAAAPRDLHEASTYYLGSHKHPRSQNKMLLSGLDAWAEFDAFSHVERHLTQPVLSIAGKDAESIRHSEKLHAKAPNTKNKLVIVEGAAHMDFYAKPAYVGPAVETLSAFYKENL